MRYVNLCLPHRIDGATPNIPLTKTQYDALVARHGASQVATMYVPEDSETVEQIREVAARYPNEPVLCQRLLKSFRRSLSGGGFDFEGFAAFYRATLGDADRTAEMEAERELMAELREADDDIETDETEG